MTEDGRDVADDRNAIAGGASGQPPSGVPTITVVGLGPAGPDLLTAGTLDALAACEHRYLRTTRHPAAVAVEGARSFDHVYESADSIDDVYPAIVEELVAAAAADGAIVYAVPGSPVVAERTVELLLADDRVRAVVLPALSFLDLVWARLGVDPIAAGARVVDGHRFEVEAAGERGPLLVAQCDSPDVLSAVKLAIGEALDTRSLLGGGLARRPAGDDHVRGPGLLPDDLRLTVIQRLGLPDEHIVEVAWDDLDREIEPDHLTSVWIPEYVAPVAFEVQRFAELVATLRRECPWDQEQTHESLKRHLLEESYEVIDAIDGLDEQTGEGYGHLEEELGDLLFQILFHATLAAEAGQFTLADVARGVHDKLHSRHPHVFGRADADDAEQVAANWEDLKKAEKGRASVFDGIPDALPALLHALKVQKKAAALVVGSTISEGTAGIAGAPAPVDVDDALARVRALGGEDRRGGPGGDDGGDAGVAIGELLFSVVDLARGAGVDPETALRTATRRHRDAVQQLEQQAR